MEAVSTQYCACFTEQAVIGQFHIDVSKAHESSSHLDFEGQYTCQQICGSVARRELLGQEDHASTFGIYRTTGRDKLANGREHWGVFADLGGMKLWVASGKIESIEVWWQASVVGRANQRKRPNALDRKSTRLNSSH